MYTTRPTAWARAVFLIGFQLLALLAFALPFQWQYLPVAVAIYLWLGFSTTLYLHRTLTHRALELAAPLRLLFALGTSVGQQGAPINWVGHHRWHHAKSDEPGEDVHSPLAGFWYSHIGWILKFAPDEDARLRRFAKDVADRDPYLWHLEKPLLNLVPHLLVAATLYFTLGPAGMLYGLYLPMALVYNVTWCVNSVCHVPFFGHRRYDTTDRSQNVWWVGLLALGEGWHNNHHAAPGRAPQGMAWYEVDLTSYLIWAFEKLGLAWNVKWEAAETGVLRPQGPAPGPVVGPLPATVAAQGQA